MAENRMPFFQLKTPQDLLRKARARLQAGDEQSARFLRRAFD